MSAAPEHEDFHDAALRRALGHAPDHAAAPDWRLRKTILQQAHEAVAPSSGSLLEENDGSPWWKRLGGGKARGSRMPWNAAFATVLIAGLATVLWQREPVPGARLDGEASVAAPPPLTQGAPAPVAPPTAPAPAAVSPPASLPVPVPGLGPAAPPRPERQPEPEPRLSIVLDPPAPPEPLRPQADEAAPPPSRADEAGERKAKQALAARTARDDEAAARQRMSPPPSPPAALASQGDAAAPARAARAPAPAVRTAATEPPTFTALSQWNRITIAQRGGATRSLSRAEAAELNALLGSAAISAVRGDPLAGTPEWRITLERNNDVLAVLEVARSQVRWREGRELPATGAPSAAALAALRNALRDAVAQQEQQQR